MLLAKSMLNIIEILLSGALIDSYITHNEILSGNNVIREYGGMKEVNKNLKTSTVHQRPLRIYKTMLSYYLKSTKKTTEIKNSHIALRNQGKLVLLSKYLLWDSKKSRFIKEQGRKGLLSKID